MTVLKRCTPECEQSGDRARIIISTWKIVWCIVMPSLLLTIHVRYIVLSEQAVCAGR